MRSIGWALLVSGCVATEFVRQPDPAPCPALPATSDGDAEAIVRKTVAAFVAAMDRKDFSTAHTLLDGTLRRRYSVERLQSDYAAEPRGQTLVSRLRSATNGPVEFEGDQAWLLVATGAYAILHLESGHWHIAALDAEKRKQ